MKRVRIFIRRLLLLFLVLGIVAILRPDWWRAAKRAAAPVLQAARPHVERAAAPLLERARPVVERARTLGYRARITSRPDARRDRAVGSADRPTGASPEPDPSSERPERPEERRGSAGEDVPVTPAGNLPPRLPALRGAGAPPPSLRRLQARARAAPSAAAYRRLADAAAAAGFPALAADAYLREARIYRRLGDVNAAVVEELKAGRYGSEGRLFLHADEPPPAALNTGERLEPAYGAYLGAFIDRDDQLRITFMDENWQTHRDAGEFAERVGKEHASLFCYLRYGKPFPARWAERLRGDGIIPHIAWEPRSLEEVRDDATLARFADALARFDAPIFIRFAGEMNGAWTPYHGNPALYRQKFRLVHRILSRRAPKAALIWCVNNIPDATIDAYYPGDDAVDWVGVNFYNVLYFDNDSSRPADRVHPVDLLQGVYRRYAARKPIAICEYAASHQAAIDPRPRPEFAATRMAQLYAALPCLFPGVKLIDWFDCNNLRHARPER